MNQFMTLTATERTSEITRLLLAPSLKDSFLFEMKDKEKAEFLLPLFDHEQTIEHLYCMVRLYDWMGAKFRNEVIQYAQAYRDLATNEDVMWVSVANMYTEALVGEYELYTAYEVVQDIIEADLPYAHNLYAKILYRLDRLEEAVTYLNKRKEQVTSTIYFEDVKKQAKLQASVEEAIDKYTLYKQQNKRYIPKTEEGKQKLGLTDDVVLGKVVMLDDFTGKDFICFDLETTGYSHKFHEIIDIGAVRVRNGVVVDTFQSFVKPKKRITSEITQLTKINNTMVEDAASIQRILPKFLEFIQDDILVGHNVNFDLRFLLANAMKYGFQPELKAMDTLALSKLHTPTTVHTLGHLCEYYNIDLNDAHRALPDAEATAMLYLNMMEQAARK